MVLNLECQEIKRARGTNRMSYKSFGIGVEDWLLGNISIPPPKKKKTSSQHGVCVRVYIYIYINCYENIVDVAFWFIYISIGNFVMVE